MNKSLASKGKLYVVATPIGNLSDISQRAKTILADVNWIAAEDTRHSGGLLQQLGITTELVSYHEHNERERAAELVEKLQQGETGALICDAGTPLISDPGYSLVAQAHVAQIPVIPIPGACAAIAALSASGLPTDKFLFEGFVSAKTTARQKQLSALAHFAHTMIFYEAPHRVLEFLEDALQIFSPQRKACVARELTKKFEAITFNTLDEIVRAVKNGQIPLKGEFVIVIAGYTQSEEATLALEQQAQKILSLLLTEVPLKLAVKITKEITGISKNTLYDWAIELQKRSS